MENPQQLKPHFCLFLKIIMNNKRSLVPGPFSDCQNMFKSFLSLATHHLAILDVSVPSCF